MEIKILFVDDDQIDLMAFERVFRTNPFNITYSCANSLKSAKELLETHEFDLIITDYFLIDGNALELLSLKKNIPCIIVTGVGNQDISVDALSKGAYDFIIKETNGDHLKTLPFVIKNAIQRSESELKLKEYKANLEETIKIRTRDLENEIKLHKKTEKKLILAEKRILKAKYSMIFALATLAESRDNETGAHVTRIREYCKLLAQKLRKTKKYKNQIDSKFIEDIFNTSILHDIGKVGIPDAILLKPGKLTPEEFEVMKTHTEIGGKTLAKVYESNPSHSYLEMATDIVLHHHEKWNGLGYPRGLAGEEISLASRITAYSDIFDALMSRRSYKESFSKEETLRIMEMEKGVILDPFIFPYFEEIFDQFVSIYEDKSDHNYNFDFYRL